MFITDLAQNMEYFRQGLEYLEEYLLSGELYWRLSDLPTLSVGGLLLTKLFLEVVDLPTPERNSMNDLIVRYENIKDKWREAFESKILREIGSRITLWKNYLEDYWNAPEEYGSAYPQEIRNRVILQLLAVEITRPFKESSEINRLDQKLQTRFVAGGFIWQKFLENTFPPIDFWYLYGRLPEK